jgi:hypothetical protein
MATDPVNILEYTQDDLNNKFAQDGWGNRLQNWALDAKTQQWPQPTGTTVEIVHETYRDGDGNIRVARYFIRSDDGEEMKVRELRDDNNVQHICIPPNN